MLTVARYGFTKVITPADIVAAHPAIYPYSHTFFAHYAPHSRPLPFPAVTTTLDLSPEALAEHLKIDAIFVFSDPRDWSLDIQLILDLTLSFNGYLGTLSPKNGDLSLPNKGYLQDGQPTLYFSNPDLWWAAKWHLPRLGQGAFREALKGTWRAVAGEGVKLDDVMFGKPNRATYEFAEKRLVAHRDLILSKRGMYGQRKLKTVYMVGGECHSQSPGSDPRCSETDKTRQP